MFGSATHRLRTQLSLLGVGYLLGKKSKGALFRLAIIPAAFLLVNRNLRRIEKTVNHLNA
jgi:hypothetical protein